MAIERIYERDIDLLLAEEFQLSPVFAGWFLEQTEKYADSSAIVVDVAVSKSDYLGESDLVVLFERPLTNERFALYIEDKINAPFQPEQLARYAMRAQNGVAKGYYSDYQILLCSPAAYRETHPEGVLFDSFVSYEAIAEYLRTQGPDDRRSAYRANLFAQAANRTFVSPKEREEDPLRDAFWKTAFGVATREFPDLEMKAPTFSSRQAWIEFRPREMQSQSIHICVALKGGSGFVDLTFRRILSRKFAPVVASLLEPEMSVLQIGNSTAIRLVVERLEVSEVDEGTLAKLRFAFAASVRLIRFYLTHRHELDVAALQSLPEPEPPRFPIPQGMIANEEQVDGNSRSRGTDLRGYAVNRETILEVGAEGGSITLLRENSEDGNGRYRVSTNETFFDDDDLDGEVLPQSEPQYADSFHAAVVLLDRYPWHRLHPLKVHSDYYAQVLKEVVKRGGLSEETRWRELLAQ